MAGLVLVGRAGRRRGRDAKAGQATVTITVPPPQWLAALTLVRDRLGGDFFDWLTAVDDEQAGLAVVVHVYSLAGRHHVFLRTMLNGPSPRLPSATGIYRGADWHERETWEMFGVAFEGHPGLVPLLLPDGFEGHPLRKDFALAARAAREWPGAPEPGEQAAGPGRGARARGPGRRGAGPAARGAGVRGRSRSAPACPRAGIRRERVAGPQPRGDRAARRELHGLHVVRAGVPGLVHLHRVAQGAGARGAGRGRPAGSRGSGSPGPRGRPRVRNALDRFAIDFSLCMYCGICVEVCPYDALFWSPEFEYAGADIRELTHERDRLHEWMATVPPPPAHDPGAPPPRELQAVPGAGAAEPRPGAAGPVRGGGGGSGPGAAGTPGASGS